LIDLFTNGGYNGIRASTFDSGPPKFTNCLQIKVDLFTIAAQQKERGLSPLSFKIIKYVVDSVMDFFNPYPTILVSAVFVIHPMTDTVIWVSTFKRTTDIKPFEPFNQSTNGFFCLYFNVEY
jgi:hypothetical protein